MAADPLGVDDLLAIVMRYVLAPPCSMELFSAVRMTSTSFSKVALRTLVTCADLPTGDLRRTFIPLSNCAICAQSGVCSQTCATWYEFPFPMVVFCNACRLYAVATLLRLNMAPDLTHVLSFPLEWSGIDLEALSGVRLAIPRSDGSRSDANIGHTIRVLSSGARGVDMVWFTRNGTARWNKTVPLRVLVELNPDFAPMARRLEQVQCWAYSGL